MTIDKRRELAINKNKKRQMTIFILSTAHCQLLTLLVSCQLTKQKQAVDNFHFCQLPIVNCQLFLSRLSTDFFGNNHSFSVTDYLISLGSEFSSMLADGSFRSFFPNQVSGQYDRCKN